MNTLASESGADVDAVDSMQMLPLHYAAREGNVDALRFLWGMQAELVV